MSEVTASPVALRPAVDADLDVILEIHNHAIRELTSVWSAEEVDRADRERWLQAHDREGHPVIVATLDDQVVGFAAYGPWRERSGYRYTVENSVYVLQGFGRRGIGRMLMSELIIAARANGMHAMIAAIEANNEPSIELHRSLGFGEPVVVPQVGTKFGRWLDLAFMRLQLDDAAPRD